MGRICRIIILLTILGGCLSFVPLVGMFVSIVGICCYEFYLYIGIPVILVASFVTAVHGLACRAMRKGWFIRSVKIGILTHGGVIVLALAIGLLGGGFATTQEVGFWAKMNYIADVDSIREWGQTYQATPDDEHTLDGKGVLVKSGKWPTCVRRLEPEMVQFCPGEKAVHLIFCGGFGHWGLTVGPKDAPSSTYGLPFRSGAWVWAQE
jgi:hypothetical protein